MYDLKIVLNFTSFSHSIGSMPSCLQASITRARGDCLLSVNVGVSAGLQETTLHFALSVVQIGFLALIGLCLLVKEIGEEDGIAPSSVIPFLPLWCLRGH